MRICITKKSPSEFPRRGMDMLDVWLYAKPYFNEGYHTDIFGQHELTFPHWKGHDRISGRMFRKIGGNVVADVWEALKYSYNFDQSLDLYDPVDYYYDAAYDYYLHRRPGASPFRLWSSDMTPINEKCEFVQRVAADRYASKMVEKEGQRWWEWILEYEVHFELNEVK